jgi:phosphoglucosamine mutase
VAAVGSSPDGHNINVLSGATYPETLASFLREGSYYLGLAFDGDTDGTLLLEPEGLLFDGDAMLYLWARGLAATGGLKPPIVVSTVLANCGLERALARHGFAPRRGGRGHQLLKKRGCVSVGSPQGIW